MGLHKCPRCQTMRYEKLKTHSYCSECNYTPDLTARQLADDDLPIPQWAIDAVKAYEQSMATASSSFRTKTLKGRAA